ncbi:MAG TPA: DJ-1 family glyoxalase III [archaeon]|nr:DJ-1 family glyoxalase III [archaeon]
MPKALVLLADGFEDIEGIAAIDILRRAGITTVTAGVTGNIVLSKHGVRSHADARFIDMDASKYDCLVIPGGTEGVDNLLRNPNIIKLARDYAESGKIVAAICMGPKVLVQAGVLKDKRATIFPGQEKLLERPRPDKVVVDGNIITSQGPGTAVEFALKIVEQLSGRMTADKIRQHIVA